MTGKKGSGTGDKTDEVKLTITELPRAGSLKVPEYGRKFSEEASRNFYQKYRTYEEAVERSNKGRSLKSVMLTMQELVPTHIQRCVSAVSYTHLTLPTILLV